MKKSINKADYKFGLWVSGELAAIYLTYEGALEALGYLEDQGLDLAIIDVDTNEVLYAKYF